MNQYDLIPTISSFLDLHLILPLLQFLDNKKIYEEEEVLKAKLNLLEKTNMVDFAGDIYKKLTKTSEISPQLQAKRKEVITKYKEWEELKKTQPLFQLLTNSELVTNLKADKNFNLNFLSQNHQIQAEHVESLYQYAKFQFDCGVYTGAFDALGYYISLSTNAENKFSALWGRLASAILLERWSEAKNDLEALREEIEIKAFSSPIKQLQHRTWLIHWALFVLFNYRGREIFEWFLSDKYLNAIQTTCPYVLRYLTALLVLNKKKGLHLKELVKVIQQESHTYHDPITEFVEALYVNFDFEESQVRLRECEKLLQNDFFLTSKKNEFIENARLHIFETYCRIHECIDISMLAEKLNLDRDAAEKWIVNLIRNAKLDAKIDSQANTVIMGVSIPSVYQQVIEKTKQLSNRVHFAKRNLSLSSSVVLSNSEIQAAQLATAIETNMED